MKKALLIIFICFGIFGGILAYLIYIKKLYPLRLIAGLSENDFQYQNHILEKFEGNAFGIDISHHQANYLNNWEKFKINDKQKIDFIFIRVGDGINTQDRYFKSHWENARKQDVIMGAYQYFRAKESVEKQAKTFIQKVHLSSGDLPPVLDVEENPYILSRQKYLYNIQKWLKIIENHYGIKPIIYTGSRLYQTHLKAAFPKYIFWIADYNQNYNAPENFFIWQFTQHGKIPFTVGNVDINVFKGTKTTLKKFTIQ